MFYINQEEINGMYGKGLQEIELYKMKINEAEKKENFDNTMYLKLSIKAFEVVQIKEAILEICELGLWIYIQDTLERNNGKGLEYLKDKTRDTKDWLEVIQHSEFKLSSLGQQIDLFINKITENFNQLTTPVKKQQ
ncbi:MAG: hypothetical protein QM528_02855 [Phycisphaerales bacterium]|nr:hypothetical protein [Phycisphaerales bacterium]